MTEITASENLSKAPEQTYALRVQLQPKESMVKKTSLPPHHPVSSSNLHTIAGCKISPLLFLR